jgi:hypothetical protein
MEELGTIGAPISRVESVGNSKLLARASFLLAICFLLVNLLVFLPKQWARTDANRDVAVYYLAARAAHNGQPIYTPQPDFGPDTRPTGAFLYAPPVAAVIAPFGGLSFVAFARLAIVVNILAFLAFVFCLVKLTGAVTVQKYVMAAAAVTMFPGVLFGVYSGQVDPLLWMLFAAGLVVMETPWYWPIAALVKPFYAWPVLVNKPNWRRLAFSALNIAVLIALGGTVCGWGSYAYWITKVLPTMSQGSFAGNFSLSFGALRLLQYLGIWHYPGGPLAPLPHLWLTVASIGAPIVTWWLMRRQEPRLKAAAVMAAATLFAPICWVGYLPVTLPLLVLLWGQLLRYYGGKRVVISKPDTTRFLVEKV